MGVFKWLRRERVTVTSHHSASPDRATPEEPHTQSAPHTHTIRTEEYKRDLAEFQARRSAGAKELTLTPVKKKCGRHSLPLSCTDCSDPDRTFNYEKKSAAKYQKNKRARCNTPEKVYEGVPNIQFLFQNQVFMPGGVFASSYSEPRKTKRISKRDSCRSPEFLVQRQIDFKDDEQDSPPEFYKNNSLPYDVKAFLEGSRSDEEEVDGPKAGGDSAAPSRGNNESDDKLWEVMSELKHLDQWADEQLVKSPPPRSEDSKSDISAYGLPIASPRNLDLNTDLKKIWNHGKWGVVPVQIKKLPGVTMNHVRKKRNTEINILRKFRHPNIILLMGIYPDAHDNVHIICERCVDSLFSILHVHGRILSAQTAVQYSLDIANALVFLRMQDFIHTEVNSMNIMITAHDTAKLTDLGPCVKVNKGDSCVKDKGYEVYSPEPQYVNIEDTREPKSSDAEPLLSANPSETYIRTHALPKPYESFHNSELYRWQAPELFTPEGGVVYPCSRSDVYSLCLVLWEGCNASIPWKLLTYEQLKHQYTLLKTGIPLPCDGTYPGGLLALLQAGLCLDRADRIDLDQLQNTLQTVKQDLDNMGYIIIPARKKSNFSSVAYDTTSPTDSDVPTPINIQHKAQIHDAHVSESSTESENTKIDSPMYESIKKTFSQFTYTKNSGVAKYGLLPEREYSSACSTPIAKIKNRLDTTPGLHRSDSTEYCSILSPNRTSNFAPNESNNQSEERPTAKLSRSFTPQSYKPLHIKVPDCNLDSIKPLIKDQNGSERSSYNFDIKNYSLPSTPIARSNKLRRNAWLSGDVTTERSMDKTQNEATKNISRASSKDVRINTSPDDSPSTIVPESTSGSTSTSAERPHLTVHSTDHSPERSTGHSTGHSPAHSTGHSAEHSTAHSVDDSAPVITHSVREYASAVFKRIEPTYVSESRPALSQRSSVESTKSKIDDESLANMNVKPLVAIHERWIYEANRKAGRSMSLPEEHSFRSQIPAVKPASHCVDTLQKSLPQLAPKRATKPFRLPLSPTNGVYWDQFSQTRDTIARTLNFPATERRDWRKDVDRSPPTEITKETKIDQCTDTKGIEDFIRELIRKEFRHLIHESEDDHEEIFNKGVTNVLEGLQDEKKEHKSFSRVKINGNNKPLLQITFSKNGENSLQVLDKCVSVTICDSPREKLNVSLEDTLTEDVQASVLKRCQAFNAIQEARSTEDLYIDDDLSTHMAENFGGRVKLIPLHGSLHEILCERQDDCCLLKVKQENGCDTIYFRCDNSDTESRDAIDGCDSQDTVVYKRSISLVEERIRVPKDKGPARNKEKIRPKSEIFAPIKRETRVLSNSSPSLPTEDREVEVNIESAIYQDSSSDECLKCLDSDEFEFLERKIEESLESKVSLGRAGLDKISEENLSTMTDDATDKERSD